jgi:hypothetical protein
MGRYRIAGSLAGLLLFVAGKKTAPRERVSKA